MIVGLTLGRLFGWVWMDPAAGLLGTVVIATWAFTLIRDTGAILLDMTPDRDMAERVHAIATADAPHLTPRLYYGMPAYAKDGKVVCFFKSAEKFNSRYATFGFEEAANLDDGDMWPTSYALTKLTKADEQRIAAMVKKAAS